MVKYLYIIAEVPYRCTSFIFQQINYFGFHVMTFQTIKAVIIHWMGVHILQCSKYVSGLTIYD
jgi:hypothetical protein